MKLVKQVRGLMCKEWINHIGMALAAKMTEESLFVELQQKIIEGINKSPAKVGAHLLLPGICFGFI